MHEQGFLHQALIYLAAGVIVVPVFKRLGLGSVLGYLVAGAFIGPWGVALVTAPEAILRFAEFGVVLLLFLVGLELNPKRVWQLRKAIFGMGAAQVLVTMLAVAAIGWGGGRAPHGWSAWASRCRRPPSASPRCRKRTCCRRPAARRASPCCCSRTCR